VQFTHAKMVSSLYIAYQLAPLAKIIAPESYIDSFIERLDEIKRTYRLIKSNS
jgi:hypothetical protein